MENINSYEMALTEVKRIILPTIVRKINPDDVQNTGLNKNDLAEITYTQIMALGYNDCDINASLNDLMPTRNPIIYSGTEEEDAVNMSLHLCIICEDYSDQIRAFKVFHKLTQEQKPYKEVIKNVKMQLLHIL